VRIFNSRPATFCAEAGIDIVAQALGRWVSSRRRSC
jgi:hypothetical protein